MQVIRSGLESEEVVEVDKEMSVGPRRQEVGELFLFMPLLVKQSYAHVLLTKVFHSA